MGTTWYFVRRITNGLRTDEPTDPDAWVRFSDDTVTFNGTVERSSGDGDLPCSTWTARVTVEPDRVQLDKSELNSRESREQCGLRFLAYGSETATLSLEGRTLSAHVDQGQNQFTLVFSADPPVAPTVSTPDLSFLPAPTARTVREALEMNPLRGKTFRAESITGRTLVGKGVTMQFGVDQVGLSAGCNGGSAGYTVDGDTITLTGGAWTLVLCGDERVMSQESWLNDFSSGSAQLSLEGSRLTLTEGTTKVVMSEAPATDPPASNSIMVTAIDEIVDSAGHHPLPQLESGDFWSQDPTLVLSGTRLTFDAGCGQYVADFTGSLPDVTVPVADGAILHDCPPTRSALAAALQYILSGDLNVQRDGAFVTLTGRDGLQVTAHTGYARG